MKIELDSMDPLDSNLDCLIIGLFDGEETKSPGYNRIDSLLGDSLRVLRETGEVSGRYGNNVLVHSLLLSPTPNEALKRIIF